jgi:hypothetical protein
MHSGLAAAIGNAEMLKNIPGQYFPRFGLATFD